MGRHVVLHSPLDPVALATRLRDILGGRKANPKTGVTGQGTEQEMMLFVYRPGGAASTRFKATIDPEGSGSVIEGRFAGVPAMTCVLVLWVGFLSIFFGVGLLLCFTGGDFDTGIGFVGISSVMMLAPFGLWWFHARSRPADEAQILQFLADKVQATPR